uniref:Uncharacterized protein n=1 Tax=Eucampia antarctica TaxID=49252 RepID=A0A7S2W1E7_9STRA|mmetsp:Transcript_18080/g.17441  ORF Transcript_18080/g.17441 Transcript_18080/m.17441 type:complete len:102 (+) Transcript_18080:110-415(+)
MNVLTETFELESMDTSIRTTTRLKNKQHLEDELMFPNFLPSFYSKKENNKPRVCPPRGLYSSKPPKSRMKHYFGRGKKISENSPNMEESNVIMERGFYISK